MLLKSIGGDITVYTKLFVSQKVNFSSYFKSKTEVEHQGRKKKASPRSSLASGQSRKLQQTLRHQYTILMNLMTLAKQKMSN